MPIDSQYRARSLSNYLALLLLSVLVPTLLLGAALVYRVSHLDRHRADQEVLRMARTVSREIDHDIQGSIETLLALASSPHLTNNDLEGFYRQALETVSLRRLSVLLKSIDGRQILNTRVPVGLPIPPASLSESDRRLLETGTPQVSQLTLGTVTKHWVIGISVPVMRHGKVAGILTLSVDPDHYQRILVAQSTGPEWILVVSDQNGRLIARSADQATYIGREIHPDVKSWSTGTEGVHRTRSLAGEDVLRGYKWASNSGWLVAAFMPAQIVDAPLQDLWMIFTFTAFVLASITIPLAINLSRRITLPIEHAVAAAVELGRGSIVTYKPSHIAEANAVYRALADASHKLQERQRELKASEARFRSVFEQSAVGFEQIDEDGSFLAINDRLCAMLGYTREECLKKSFRELTHPDDIAQEEKQISALLRGEIPFYEIEKRLIAKSGQPVWVRVTSSPVRNPESHILYRSSVVEDITERRRHREAESRLVAIVQSSPHVKITTNVWGEVETWNPAAEKLFGYSVAEVLGKSLAIVAPDDRKHEIEENRLAVLNGETVRRETVRRHKDGTLVDVALTATPIRSNGRITSISVAMEDNRDRKRRERQIMLLNRELAHRIKNTLAIIQSIANQTMRSSPSPEAFRMAFQGRLQSLSAANDLLMRTSWDGAELGEFVDRQLAPLMARPTHQLEKSGPALLIPADLSVHLSLALHELGTNAIKHGAWSMPGGRVSVAWKLDRPANAETAILTMVWTEHGGPKVTQPTRTGFGTMLIERGIPDAKVRREFNPDGLVCTIEIPLPMARKTFDE